MLFFYFWQANITVNSHFVRHVVPTIQDRILEYRMGIACILLLNSIVIQGIEISEKKLKILKKIFIQTVNILLHRVILILNLP